LARRSVVAALVSAGIEMAAGEMAVGKTPCGGALVSIGIKTPAREMAVGRRRAVELPT